MRISLTLPCVLPGAFACIKETHPKSYNEQNQLTPSASQRGEFPAPIATVVWKPSEDAYR
jgi:hypothetical protein